jgi:hypothetical protein
MWECLQKEIYHDMLAIAHSVFCFFGLLTTKIMSRVLSTTESLCVASSTSLQEKHMFCTNIPKSITQVFNEVVKIKMLYKSQMKIMHTKYGSLKVRSHAMLSHLGLKTYLA